MKKLFLTATANLVALIFFAQPVNAAPADGANDPGAQLERTREQLERQRIAEQISEDQKNRGAKVEKQDETTTDEQSPAVEFLLQKINFDDSEILTAEELDAIS